MTTAPCLLALVVSKSGPRARDDAVSNPLGLALTKMSAYTRDRVCLVLQWLGTVGIGALAPVRIWRLLSDPDNTNDRLWHQR